MIVIELEGIELDRCVACRGTWLDAGELEQVLEFAGISPGRITEAVRSAGSGRRGQRRCPRCRRRMHVVTIGESPAVEVDRCPIGHGLWLDAGELRAVVQAFSHGEEGHVAKCLADMLRHDLAES
jgi:Zn-finger nucleic acid-binding protein